MSDTEPRNEAGADTGSIEEAPTVVRSPSPVSAQGVPEFDLDNAATQVRSHLSGSAPDASVPAAPLSEPVSTAPGNTLVGRYTVLNPLGRGGMGEVVAAYDSRLDRRVALKLLRRELDSSQSQRDLETRMLREAQAMARLSHPNVVAIYDVGMLEDGAIFIAMEMVEGQTLRHWCEQAPRSWREILSAYQDAARGLAAAHEAGLVHRDFKPENVLVGKDGRVRVTDFGLARAESSQVPTDAAPADPSSAVALPPGALDSPLTLQGTLLGTPRYMAPELLRAGPADARSDLFAFCVALYEALYRKHPFTGATQAESTRAQLEGRAHPPPPGSDVPAWVARTLLQGLRAEPSQRPASMLELVSALEEDLEARRRARKHRVGLVALVAGLAALALWGQVLHQEGEPGCAHLERRLAGTWDEAVKAQVRKAFLDTRLPYAQDTFMRMSALLDGYAGTWVKMRTEACEATLNQEPSHRDPAVLELHCLERRRVQLRALTELFSRGPDRDTVSRAVQSAQSLPPLDACADLEALTATVPPPEDPAVRARAEALQVRVDRLETLRMAGKFREGLSLGEELLPEVEQVDYAPLRAQARYQVAALQEATGEYVNAEALARKAIPEAARSKDLVLVARSWSLLLRLVGWRQARHLEATGLALAVESAVECADDDRARSDALNDLAIVFQEMGRYEEAQARHALALELRQKALGPEHPLVAVSLNNLGTVLAALGKYEEARASYERSLNLRQKILGPEHPLIALSYSNLGTAFGAMGKHEEARVLYERALALREKALGPDHPDVASSLNNLGTALDETGRYDEARALHERALALREKALGTDHPDVANSLNSLGGALRSLGRYDEAWVRLEQSLAVREKVLGSDHPDVASSLVDLGAVLRAQGRHEEARTRLERALSIQEKALGAEHPDLALTLHGLGNVLRSLGRYGEARARHERALALREKALGPEHPQVAESLGSLGRTLVRMERWEEAERTLERARVLWEKTSTPSPRAYAEGLLGLAELRLARGQVDEVLPKLEQALLLAPADLRAELESVLKRAHASPSSTRPLMAVPVP